MWRKKKLRKGWLETMGFGYDYLYTCVLQTGWCLGRGKSPITLGTNDLSTDHVGHCALEAAAQSSWNRGGLRTNRTNMGVSSVPTLLVVHSLCIVMPLFGWLCCQVSCNFYVSFLKLATKSVGWPDSRSLKNVIETALPL